MTESIFRGARGISLSRDQYRATVVEILTVRGILQQYATGYVAYKRHTKASRRGRGRHFDDGLPTRYPCLSTMHHRGYRIGALRRRCSG